MLLAVAIGVCGYIGMLALRRTGAGTVAMPLELPELALPEPPQRLPVDPTFHQPPAAPPARPPAAGRTLTITVRDVPAALRAEACGVATFQADSGSEFAWVPLATATTLADGSLQLQSRANAGGDVVVTLATARRFARHGYLARHQVAVPAGDVAATPVELLVRTDMVRLTLSDPAITPVPLRLARTDDPQWLPMELGSGSINVPRGGELRLLLGAGNYELRDPLAPERQLQFAVPGTPEIDISALLAPAKGERP